MIRLTFMPLLPVWALVVLATAVIGLGLYASLRHTPGAILRSLAMLLTLAWLSGPRLEKPFFESAPQDVLMIVDHTPSMALRGRLDSAEQAARQLEDKARNITGLTLHRMTVQGADHRGTRLFDTLNQADLPPGRFSGAILVTDGTVHDVPTTLPGSLRHNGTSLPLYVLLTGQGEETDRRVRVLQAPPYALVGKDATIRLIVDDLGTAEHHTVTLTVSDGDMPPRHVEATPGTPVDLTVRVRHPGEMLVSLTASPLAGEVSKRNNTTTVRINGVRDRLKVLLVSGTPNQGERIWRRLLKADPSVDLVHFTILRPPDKDDGTPLSDLALIPFPIKELFQDRIRQFDLIILDGFHNAGILPQNYLSNIADYVRGGGGLLLTAGPEFTEDGTLQDTPLADILPAHISADGVRTERFVPVQTVIGRRHPVTTNLSQPWGPWYRALTPDHVHGTPLLTGPQNQPLLLLDTVRKGRVALLLSDQLWLWSRGEGGGGPQAELLKRLSHWLMKEPDLEENQLRAMLTNNTLAVTRHTESATLDQPADVTSPDGVHHRLQLARSGDGIFSASLAVPDQDGIWTIRQDGLVTSAARSEQDTIENGDLRATAKLLAPLADESGGATHWLGSGPDVPSIRQVASGALNGAGWIGFPRQMIEIASSSRLIPLCPSWLTLGGVLTLMFYGWWREGHSRRR